MNKNYFLAVLFLLAQINGFSQSQYLNPAPNVKTKDILTQHDKISSFTVKDTLLFALDGDTLRVFNLNNNLQINKLPAPDDYKAFPTFVSLQPDGHALWIGYTVSGNTDDRIYSVDLQSGQWKSVATLAGNYDLQFRGDHILVSGLNSAHWGDPNAIFLLDTTGTNFHRKIIETGGSAAGFAIDKEGDIFFATSSFSQQNRLYRWESNKISTVLDDLLAAHLTTSDADILTDIPATASDTHADEAGNICFVYNDFAGDKVVAMWDSNKITQKGYITLAVANGDFEWLTYLSSRGNVLLPDEGNELFVLGFGRPIGRIYVPRRALVQNPVSNKMAFTGDPQLQINLDEVFVHPENDAREYTLTVHSDTQVAKVEITDNMLEIDFLSPGQTNITLSAEANGHLTSNSFVIGVLPVIKGDFVTSTFEDPGLGAESYWNGADGSGGFASGLAFFPNSYNSNWGVWSGWSYSNISDTQTEGWDNQYSAITSAGVTAGQDGDSNYAIAYNPPSLRFDNPSAHLVKGMFITNATYAALSMKKGDLFSKKFGGEEGNDPDWFRLSIWGHINGEKTDSIHFYLADFRFEDNTQDYIIQTWQWVELSSLGKVDSLAFALSSSDVGIYGMNTPSYFAIDNVYVLPDMAPVVSKTIDHVTIYDHEENGITIPLAGVFTDPDDDDNQIVISIKEVSEPELVTVNIVGSEIHVAPLSQQAGVATITLEALSNGKVVTTSFTITIQSTVATTNPTPAPVIAFPNPTNGTFSLRGITDPSQVSIQLFNLAGQMVMQQNTLNDDGAIHLSGLTPGPYMLRVIQNNEVNVLRVILK
jgi:hypothetical protein